MRRRALWAVPVLIVSVVVAADPAGATLPGGATQVAVTQGSTTSNVNAHLHAASFIKGTIRTTGGQLVTGAVSAYSRGRPVATGFANNGAYTINGLFPTRAYAVCISGFSIFSPSSSTGFLGRCYKNAGFNGRVPKTATLVTPGSSGRSGINITVAKAAAIRGKATTTAGKGVPTVLVVAYNRSSKASFFGSTNSHGAYVIKGLPAAAKGYTVCFNPFSIGTRTGLRPRCYKNKSWNGRGVTSSRASVVAVALGHVHSKVNQALPRGGAISGHVADANNGRAIANDIIVVFTAKGRRVGFGITSAKGNYIVRGLAASTSYRVCAAPTVRNTSTTSTRYQGRCWKAITWNGRRLPPGTRKIGVKIGFTHKHVNFRLGKRVTKLGSIAGTVTEKAGGHPLAGATVHLFSNAGGSVSTTTTNSAGHYAFRGLRASRTGYAVCAEGSHATSSVSPPATGWAPRCNVDATWNGLTLPASARRLPLAAGQNRTGVNVALHAGGAISGTTFQGGGTTPAPNVTVDVFLPSGRLVTATFSGFGNGAYTVGSLSPGKYVVCFDGRQNFVSTGFLPQCFNGVAWSG